MQQDLAFIEKRTQDWQVSPKLKKPFFVEWAKIEQTA